MFSPSRKRKRIFIASDDDECLEVAVVVTPRKVATATTPLRTKPKDDAKFWVESIYSPPNETDVIVRSPSRRPLSVVENKQIDYKQRTPNKVASKKNSRQVSFDNYSSGKKLIQNTQTTTAQSSPKKQLSLDNFFSRPKAKAKTKEPENDWDSSAIIISDSESEDDLAPPKKKARIFVKDPKPRVSNIQKKSTSSTKATERLPRVSVKGVDQSDLPPISSIPKMFDDLVSRAGKLDKLVDRLNGRKLRVATMCSGTESPLLALRMITRSLFAETGKKLEIEHIFSCEIEPFKQAYIERNFSPPILFRDVLELADDYAYFPSLALPPELVLIVVILRMEQKSRFQETLIF